MALDKKRYETRNWQTRYRGWLAIHTAKAMPAYAKEACEASTIQEALGWHTPVSDVAARIDTLPRGAIVAVVKLVNCLPTEVLDNHGNVFGISLPPLSEQERAFGNYEPGRFAWVTEDLFRLPEPIPFKARRGLFDLPYDTVMELRRQYKAVHGTAGRGLVA